MLNKEGKRPMKAECSCSECGHGTDENLQTTRFIPFTEEEKAMNKRYCMCDQQGKTSRVF